MDEDIGAFRAGVGRQDGINEVRFWVRILKEHSLFIQIGLPADRPDLKAEAGRFYELFQGLQNAVESKLCLDPTLIAEIRRAVIALIEFKHLLTRLAVQCDLPGSQLYPLLLAHITREAVHFLAFLDYCAGGQTGLQAILAEQSFWLRQMKEHIEFVISLLDPSERELLAEAQSQRVIFSALLETARDLESMAEAEPETFGTVVRFTETLITRVTALRDFKAAAYELALLCRVLSVVPTPLLLDHIRREADKFLDELRAMRVLLRKWEPACRRPS
ncbi:MAG: DUF2935 domain-containing protein [Bacillota bacterium]